MCRSGPALVWFIAGLVSSAMLEVLVSDATHTIRKLLPDALILGMLPQIRHC